MSENMIYEGSPDNPSTPESELVHKWVDVHPAATSSLPNEEAILREEFGEPNSDGFYTGGGE